MCRNEFEAEVFCSGFYAHQALSLVLSLVGFRSDIGVVLAEAKHAVDDLGELTCGGKDRNWVAFVTSRPTEEGASCCFLALQCLCAHTEDGRHTCCAHSVAALLW